MSQSSVCKAQSSVFKEPRCYSKTLYLLRTVVHKSNSVIPLLAPLLNNLHEEKKFIRISESEIRLRNLGKKYQTLSNIFPTKITMNEKEVFGGLSYPNDTPGNVVRGNQKLCKWNPYGSSRS